MADQALSAKEQIANQVGKDLEPKLDLLLAQKAKPQAIQKNDTFFKKERHIKYGRTSSVDRNLRDRTLKFRTIL